MNAYELTKAIGDTYTELRREVKRLTGNDSLKLWQMKCELNGALVVCSVKLDENTTLMNCINTNLFFKKDDGQGGKEEGK